MTAEIRETAYDWYITARTAHASKKCAGRNRRWESLRATVRRVSGYWRYDFCRRRTLHIEEIATLGNDGII